MANSAAALAGDRGPKLPRLTETQLLVLWSVISDHLEWGNEFQVPSSAIAEAIGVDAGNVRRALTALCDRGVIAPIDDLEVTARPGRPRRYILDPAIAYHGEWGENGDVRRNSAKRFSKARSEYWMKRPPSATSRRRK